MIQEIFFIKESIKCHDPNVHVAKTGEHQTINIRKWLLLLSNSPGLKGLEETSFVLVVETKYQYRIYLSFSCTPDV